MKKGSLAFIFALRWYGTKRLITPTPSIGVKQLTTMGSNGVNKLHKIQSLARKKIGEPR